MRLTAISLIAAGFATMVALTAPTVSRAQSLYLDPSGSRFRG